MRVLGVDGLERERRKEVVARLGWVLGAAMLLLLITVQPFVDGNAWWHLALGRLITSHGIPAHEPFSFVTATHPWVGQQWLFDVVLAGLVGARGVGVASAVIGVATACGFLLAALAVPRTSRISGAWLAFAMVLSGLVASRLLGVSAAGISLLGTGAVLYALARWREGRAAAVWILPPLFLVWANVDTLFVAGLLIVAATLLVTSLTRPDGAHRGHLAGALVMSALLALINPYGPGLYASVFTVIADPAIAQLTTVWASPDFHTWWLRLFEAEGVLLVVFWVTGGGPEPVDAVVGIAALIAALWSETYVGLFAVIALPQVALHGARAWRRHVTPRITIPLRVEPERLRVALAGGLLAAVVAAVLVVGARQVTPAAAASYEASHYPVAASDFAAAHYPGQRIYSTDTWGGYLAYRFPAGRVVFLYDQGSTFGDAAAKSYTTIHLLQNGWEEVLRANAIQHAIVLDTSQEASALHELGWTVACYDSASSSVVLSAPPSGATPSAARPLTATPADSPAC